MPQHIIEKMVGSLTPSRTHVQLIQMQFFDCCSSQASINWFHPVVRLSLDNWRSFCLLPFHIQKHTHTRTHTHLPLSSHKLAIILRNFSSSKLFSMSFSKPKHWTKWKGNQSTLTHARTSYGFTKATHENKTKNRTEEWEKYSRKIEFYVLSLI